MSSTPWLGFQQAGKNKPAQAAPLGSRGFFAQRREEVVQYAELEPDHQSESTDEQPESINDLRFQDARLYFR